MKLDRRWIAGGLVAAVLVVPFLLKGVGGDPAVEVEIEPAAERDIRPTILASGVLAYRNEVNLTAEVVAKVEAILVEEGDMVEAGEVVLTLDPETYRNAIEREQASRRQSVIAIQRQRATLELRQRQYERAQQLVAEQMIGQEQFEETRNQLQIAQVELRSNEEALRRADAILGEAREQLAKTEVRSPIAGQVVALPIKVGETAIPSTSSLAGAQLMTIANTSAIQAELQVDEGDIGKVRAGQQVDVYAAAYPDRALEGRVTQIALAPTVSGQSRAYEVTVDIRPPDDIELRSGMSARADIFLSDGSKKLAVPVEAVIAGSGEDGDTGSHAWLARDGKAAKVAIVTGVSDDRWEEITEGLSVGDPVIVGPARTLRRLAEGDAVKPLDPKGKRNAAGDDGEGGDEDEDDDDGEPGNAAG